MLNMELSVITVNTNDKEKILEQIESVRVAAVGVEYEQIISDNGSIDGSVEEIQTKYPEVKIVKNWKNIGFGAANNSAFKISAGKFLLFLNPDMHLAPGSLRIFLDWMERNADVGIASPKLVDEFGKFNENAKPRRFPSLRDQVAILLKLPHIFPGVLDNYLYKNFDFEKEQVVDSVRGSFMLTRREFLERLGWAFDPRYFIWFEDVDICREAWRNEYKVMYTPVISCLDYVGQNFKRLPSLQKQKWFTASMVIYFKKWHSTWQWLVVAGLRPVAIFLVWLESKIKK